MAETMDTVFQELLTEIQKQQVWIATIAQKLGTLEISGGGGGGGGNATVEDYQSGKQYTRNVLLVDPSTETMYRVLSTYTSNTVAADVAAGKLKLIGFESQIVNFDHNPTQEEISTLPDQSTVLVYNPNDNPYEPST